jgi:hypothetical protein
MPETIAGVPIPDSRLAGEATELLYDSAPPLLYHHSLRVYLFGALRGNRRGLTFDAELLYLGAVFHDLGLTERFRSARDRFEVDGANAARQFLRKHGVPKEAVALVWDAIALHTTPGIPWHKQPEVALVTAGVELDVMGLGFTEVSDDAREEVLAAHPRKNFKADIVRAFANGIAHKPETVFGNVKADVLERMLLGYRRPNFCDLIATAPFPD